MLWIVKNRGSCCFRTTWKTIPRESQRVHRLYLGRFGHKHSQASADNSFADDLRYPPLLKPFLFTVAVSGGVLCATAYATNRDTEKWARWLKSTNVWTVFTPPPTSGDLHNARHLKMLAGWRSNLNKVKTWLGNSPGYFSELAAYVYATAAQKWATSLEGRRVCRTIIAMNSIIWLAWQIPRLRPMMTRHFLHYPLSGFSHTLLTAVFSHKNLWHLVFNSLALSGFGKDVVFGSSKALSLMALIGSTAMLYFSSEQARGQSQFLESTSRYHFLSFLVSAGLFSSFLSHAIQVRFYYPHIVSKLSSSGAATTIAGVAVGSAGTQTAAIAPAIAPSLGASGAIWACVSLTALAFPEAHMAFFIPSSMSIPIQAGTAGMMAFDVIGIIRGWRFFDHWAHLGGAMFGGFYYIYGPRIWEEARKHTKPPQEFHSMWR